MKRVLFLILMLCVVVTGAQAELAFGITNTVTSDVTYTSSNMEGLSKGSIEVKYAQKTITFKDVTISATSALASRLNLSNEDGWTIKISGTNIITNYLSYAWWSFSNCKNLKVVGITNDAELLMYNRVSSNNYTTINTLTLRNTDITFSKLKFNFTCINGSSIESYDSSITFDCAQGKLNPSSAKYPMTGVNNTIKLLGTQIVLPIDCSYNGTRFVTENNTSVMGSVEFNVVTDYGLSFKNTTVSGRNYKDVLGDGKVSFDPETSTLTINGVKYVGNGTEDIVSIYNMENDCNVVFKGIYSEFTNINSLIYCRDYFKGKLKVSSSPATNSKVIVNDSRTIFCDNRKSCEMCLQDFNLEAKNMTSDVISDFSPNRNISADITFDNVNMNVTFANSTHGLFNFAAKSFELKNSGVLSPDGTSIKNNMLYNSDGTTKFTQLQIVNKYPLSISGTPVTFSNASDILGNGKVSYDHNTKTLTLNNANIGSPSAEEGINADMPLTIKLIGSNTITATENSSGVINAFVPTNSDEVATTIVGADASASLTINRSAMSVWAMGGGLRIKDCHINANGSFAGISGAGIKNSTKENLYIDNAWVKTNIDNQMGSVCYFSSITLKNNVGLIEPADAAIGVSSEGFWGVVKNGEFVKTSVFIAPRVDYEIKINGSVVTSLNCDDILNDGNVKYDPINNDLFLKKANLGNLSTIECSASRPLRILVEGSNVVRNYIKTKGSLTVSNTADGFLKVENGGIVLEDGDLYVQKTDLRVPAESGIVCEGKSHKVSIYESEVSASSIQGFDSFVTTRCHIASPRGAYFDAAKRGVVDKDGNLVTTGVTISSHFNLMVNNVIVSHTNLNDILGDGKVSYEPQTSTLTLNNATIGNAETPMGIYSTEPLIIKLVGNNIINATSSCIYNIAADENSTVATTIVGQGAGATLTINSEIIGLNANGGSLNIKDCELNINAKFKGIAGNNQKEKLGIHNATVNVAPTSTYGIGDLGTIVLDGVAVVEPDGARATTINNVAGVYGSDNTYVKDKILLSPYTSYNLEVNGKSVTSINKSDILGNGKVSYDPATNVLQLNQATLRTLNCMSLCQPDVTLKVEGTCTITGSIKTYVPLTIKGGSNDASTASVLNISNSTGSCISTSNASLTIEKLELHAQGTWGIVGSGSETLTLRNSTLYLTGTTGSIGRYKKVQMVGCDIITPYSTTYSESQQNMVDANGTVQTDIKIDTNYGIVIAGELITPANADDVFWDGTVSYDHSQRTLTLRNATIGSVNEKNGIKAQMPLRIQLVGHNTITSQNSAISNGYVATSAEDVGTVIYGQTPDAELTLTTANGISLNGGNLTVQDCHLSINATTVGITGVHLGSYDILTIEDAELRVSATRIAGISGFHEIKLQGVELVTPVTAHINVIGNNASVRDANNKYETGSILIASVESYGIKVDDIVVNNRNCADLFSDGAVSYDPQTNTLALTDANLTNITIPDSIATDIRINIEGSNTITNGIVTGVATTITGNSTSVLNIQCPTDACIKTQGADLTIENIQLNAHGQKGFAGADTETLTLRNATLSVGGEHGSVCGYKILKMEDCGILSPYLAYFDEANHCIADTDDKLVITEVVIDPSIEPNAIYNINHDSNETPTLYNLHGQPVGKGYRGIVIINGRKVQMK